MYALATIRVVCADCQCTVDPSSHLCTAIKRIARAVAAAKVTK